MAEQSAVDRRVAGSNPAAGILVHNIFKEYAFTRSYSGPLHQALA